MKVTLEEMNYETPQIEIILVEVEKGFANSLEDPDEEEEETPW